MENLYFFYVFSSFIFLLSIKLLTAADTITPSRFINDGEKLVSSSQKFELGFFSPGNSKDRYLGMWYKISPEAVVWVANRNTPLLDAHGVLTINNNGNLVLLNQTNGTIWSSNISRKVENPLAQLLDTGNLVIRDNSSRNTSERYLWQSFDYPSDTLLPDMKVGWDLKTGLERYLTSWRTTDDPFPGNYTHRLDIQVLPQITLYRGTTKVGRSGPWNGVRFEGTPSYSNFLYEPTLVRNEDEISYTYESYSRPIIMRLNLKPSGIVQHLIWNDRTGEWDVVFSAPGDSCGSYSSCGANSFCSSDKAPNCECLEGFKLKSQDNSTWPKPCVRSHSVDCKSEDRFIKLDDVKVPDLIKVSVNESMNLRECEAECLKNCSCRAYTNTNLTGGGSGCLMWFGDLIDIRKSMEPNTGQSMYVRVPASEQAKKKLIWIVVISVITVALLPGSYIFYQWRRKLNDKENLETIQNMLLFDISTSIATRENEFCEGDSAGKIKSKASLLPLFSFASVSAATDNFSMENKLGEGGFGPVYKGKLLNGHEVAVKRLSSQSCQGPKEFKNEMVLISKLQHRNLVRLIGCCIEQGEKILIYEYMSNKSLDFLLFDPTKRGFLGWRARVRIIDGIAQGLLYLHQYSTLRIIHRDLKASNILLDSDMNPKISDFGMARIFDGDELQANTNRIVGTYGYMSPEYALQGLFSIKSDVFSFGILLLEILCGKKNTGFYNTESLNLLGHAWDLWKEDKALDMMDSILKNEASYSKLMRYVNVALLCVQENPADRPTMLDVVSMLTNEHYALPSPKQPAFSHVRSVTISNTSTSRQSEPCSVNNVTVSLIKAR